MQKIIDRFHPKRSHALYIALFLLLPLLGFWRNFDFSGLNLTFFDADFTGFYFADFVMGSRILENIRNLKPISEAFWDPYNLIGLPLIGGIDRIGLFYPIKFIFYFFASFFHESNQVFIATYYSLFHLSLAGIFTYFFANHCLRYSRFTSFLIGVLYAISGALVHLVVFTSVIVGATFLPLQLYFLFKAIDENSFSKAVFAGFAFSPVLLAGYFPMFVYNNIFISLFLFFYFCKDFSSFFKAIKLFLFANTIAVLSSSITLLPNIEMRSLAERQPYNIIGSAANPFTESGLINYLVPHLFGVDSQGAVFGYIGIIGLFLFFLAVRHSKEESKKFFLISAIFFLILSLGNLTSLHALAYKFIPFYGSFRRTSFLHYIVTFCLAILAGQGFQLIEEKQLKLKEIVKQIKNIFIIFFVIWLGLVIAKPYIKIEGPITEMTSSVFISLIFAAAGFVITRELSKKNSSYFKFFIVLIIVIDLFTLISKNTGINSSYNPYIFNSKSAIFSTFEDQANENFWRVNMLEPSIRYNSALAGIYQDRGYYGLTTQTFGLLTKQYDTSEFKPASPLYDILGVRYIVTSQKVEEKDLKNARIFAKSPLTKQDIDRFTTSNGSKLTEGTDIYVYENLDVIPRVALVGNVVKAENDQEAVEHLDRIDIHNEAIITSTKNNFPNLSYKKEGSWAKISEYQSSFVKIDAQSQGKSLLVLSDSYYPGWEVSVDGKREQIYKTNVGLRGVFINNGTHEVVFKYKPYALYFGAITSLFTLLISIVFLIIKNRRIKTVPSS